jgi:ribonuclease BN (tRNA processing enzyme)
MAAEAKVKQVLLSHLMRRTIDRKQETLRLIRQHYHGPVSFPDDLDRVRP